VSWLSLSCYFWVTIARKVKKARVKIGRRDGSICLASGEDSG
jgi:hypothetical protein